MAVVDEQTLRQTAAQYGQDHIFRFWDELDEGGKARLLEDIGAVDFRRMEQLIEKWVRHDPPPEEFGGIDAVEVIPPADPAREDAREALRAGEAALRAGRVGVVLVAGGQGTRLGFDGPKGAYPIGPVTGKTLFEYHAAKLRKLEMEFGCTLPWYIMVSASNAEATRMFFEDHDYFGLQAGNVYFFQQAMVPCIGEDGKFLLESKDRLAKNPNGHGGCIPALVDNGIIEDCRRRGVDTLTYFQVDNWAIKPADPYYIGYHLLRGGEMSSKVHRKQEVREAVGVHCLCDGEYRVIEYSELDLYPQLLERDQQDAPVHYAGNPAIHMFSVDFVERVYREADDFPWHRAHKKVPHLDAHGGQVNPEKPNAYKFETFIFDALRFVQHPPIALEIHRLGEYTPIKQFEGSNSVVQARKSQNRYWAAWIEAAGSTVPRDADGYPEIDIEISPLYARTAEQFVERSKGKRWPTDKGLFIDAEGEVHRAED
ncbi:MAG: UDPGP type 1 family protein [Candidatus Hydrogenedentes bacterium]|nr:UDPGP type 1 family protein [Candidatus Hydrogenedentota bacterium]